MSCYLIYLLLHCVTLQHYNQNICKSYWLHEEDITLESITDLLIKVSQLSLRLVVITRHCRDEDVLYDIFNFTLSSLHFGGSIGYPYHTGSI